MKNKCMINPCEECIVTSMCKISCKNLKSYINDLVLEGIKTEFYDTVTVAHWIRRTKTDKYIGEARIRYKIDSISSKNIILKENPPHFIISDGKITSLTFQHEMYPLEEIPSKKGLKYYVMNSTGYILSIGYCNKGKSYS